MLHDILKPVLDQDPDRRALEFHGRFWSYAELDADADRLAATLLALGLEPMDRIAVLLQNQPETVITYLACFKAGFVCVPLDYRHRTSQIEYALGHSEARLLLADVPRLKELKECGAVEHVDHLVTTAASDIPSVRLFQSLIESTVEQPPPEHFEDDELCLMIYTSGTTSRPKGVTLSRGAIKAGVTQYLAQVPIRQDDVQLIAAPITRPMALRSQLLPILRAGGCACLIEHFEIDAYLDAIQRPPAKTMTALLPAALTRILHHKSFSPEMLANLRLCISGGDHVPPALHAEFLQLTGLALTEECGSSEAGQFAINPPFGRKKPGSIGLPFYGVQVRLLDRHGDDVLHGETGEIVVNTPAMMDGYWNDTARTRRAISSRGLRTGDLGRFDDDGFLWFMGRKRDVIIRGGSNVSPLEVESVLNAHPAVSESCVVGVTNEDLGQEIFAYITRRSAQTVSADELKRFAAESLADYMIPDYIASIAEMPHMGSGKTDRDQLKHRAEAELAGHRPDSC